MYLLGTARSVLQVGILISLLSCLPGLAAAQGGAAVEGGLALPAGLLSGRALDPSGAVVPGVTVVLRAADGQTWTTVTDAAGRFAFARVPPGGFTLTADGAGFTPVLREVRIAPGQETRLDVSLEISGLAEVVVVAPDRIIASADLTRRLPGSMDILDLALLENNRILTTGEALRKASGVHVREEEGLGLRPNIGIRGLNPTRSSRVLLLEDGIPLAYAPYGDNAAYYHPPIERFERVELLKGAGQIAYGPMTVGGVINYVTPAPPGRSRGSVLVTGGNRDYLNAQGGWGTTFGRTGIQLDGLRKQGDGARENVSSTMHDLTGKVVTRAGDRHILTIRGSYYGEDSNLTYSGLREDEYHANPRQNPFRNDFFYVDRYGSSLTHAFTISPALVATTSVYTSTFRRHWWRQSSNSAQRPNDAADPACGGMANLNTTCGNEGRLRRYVVWGVEPRFRASNRFAGLMSDTDFGVRVHVEDQERRQENGTTPTARSGTLVENNERQNVALSGFVQNRFARGPWSVTPGLRLERVEYERTNRLLNVAGRTDLIEIIPGIGTAYSPDARYTMFAGVHRGFTPPRTEDIINNTTGGAVDLDPERSWNYEVGVRSRLLTGVQVDGAFFRMDYENQVIPATLAGGIGSTLTNAGATTHQGVELSSRVDSAIWSGTGYNVYARVAYTWLPVAEFEGTRFSSVPGFGSTPVGGNRLPYAPEHLLTAGVGFTARTGLDLNLEAVLTGEQFADDLNTVVPSPDGQRGLLPAYTLWNAAVNYPASRRLTLFAAVKNFFDRTAIVDRSRGILPTAPRMIQAGVKLAF
ncbi:MAG TPA: TonB-dependent receptor [Vicinamibacterales bacterium]|nr:TonB-dependent receptor [Vicinamibacterales bacterium]